MKTIDELAWEVLDNKWGKGDERKKRLEEKGYDYYAVQKRVNEIVAELDKIMDACEAQAEWSKNSKYEWESNPTVEKSKKKETCVTYVACVLQRLGILPSGKYIWHNKKGEVVGANDKMVVVYPKNKNLRQLKGELRKGDIIMDGDKTDLEGGSHIFILTGKWRGDKPIVWDNHSAQGRGGKSYAYSRNRAVIAIVRLKMSDKYDGKMPTLKIVKTNAEVIADAVRFACWIAEDNDFHYGYTDKHGSKNSKDWHPNAHHNGCYFCGTNVDHGSRSKAGIVDYQHTYCCNPFVGACWAHGGCVPKALALCQKGSSWGFSEGSGYDTSNLFDRLGKPSKSKLKAGDVLCSDSHVALYIGNGKIAEAASGDDNVRHSKSWNKSIRTTELTDSRYKGFKRVYRFKSSVNTTANIYFGEISERVKLLQKYLKWYGYDIDADGIFGEETHKAVRGMQKSLGVAVDGIVGAKTLAAMNSHRK